MLYISIMKTHKHLKTYELNAITFPTIQLLSIYLASCSPGKYKSKTKKITIIKQSIACLIPIHAFLFAETQTQRITNTSHTGMWIYNNE